MGTASRTCTDCHTPVPDDAAFCPTCGAPTPTHLREEVGEDFEPRLKAALDDRYRIERELGRGGMAVVYLAHDVRHERQVAVKVLRPELAASVGSDRFLREIKLAAKLTHQNVLAVYDSGEADGFLYYVMPYVDGESLRHKLNRERQMAIGETLRLTGEIAEGLEYAHEQGVIHRDIKPENILLLRGHALIADFGIAKALARSGASHLTSTGTSVGTPLYMSPEQAAGDPLIDHRADLYSLGCMLYEMLAGEPPFTGPTVQAIVAKHAMEPRPSVRTVRDTVPWAVDETIRRAMAKAPADRVETASAFVEALQAEGTSAQPDEQGALAGKAGIPVAPGRIPARWVLGVVAVVALVVLAVVLWTARPFGARRQASDVPRRLSLLISTEERATQPSVSPDGSTIVYVGGDSSRFDLFVRRVRGGNPLQLTNDAAFEEHPAFSPDGERIVFARRDSPDGAPSIWVVPTLGGERMPVAVNGRWPAWSPDGSRLAFVETQTGGRDVLVTTAAEGGDRTVVFENEDPYLFLRSPAWSPHGTQLAFVRSLGGSSGEVWLVSVDGGAPRRLTRDPDGVRAYDPEFTADGAGIVHASNRAGTTNLWLAPLDGGPPTRLTTGAGPDEAPSVARDGSIVYANVRERTDLLAYDLGTLERRTLLRHFTFLGTPAASPNGREIAFSRAEVDGSWHIWIMALDDLAPRQLTTGGPPQVYARFTPDGESLVYMTWATPGRVWRIPRTGGPPTALTPENEDAGYGDVSPDGRWLVYARTEGGATHIYMVEYGRGDARRLTETPGTLPRWSPDAQWIAFSPNRGAEGGIFVIRPDGTDERRLTDVGGWPTWFPDAKRIGFVVVGADQRQRAYVVPLDGGAAAPIEGIEYHLPWAAFDVAPDGRTLLTTDVVHLGDEIWLLEPGR